MVASRRSPQKPTIASKHDMVDRHKPPCGFGFGADDPLLFAQAKGFIAAGVFCIHLAYALRNMSTKADTLMGRNFDAG